VTAEVPEKRTGEKSRGLSARDRRDSRPGGRSAQQSGHLVTVFERADRVGGLLMYGIPNFKLEKTLHRSGVKIMEARG
jgi:glutamate synthase (NADPH/NADH) small chain